MEKEDKKQRFIDFFDKMIEQTSNDVKEKISQFAKNKSMTLKIRIRDLDLTRCINFCENNMTISNKPPKKIDCSILFDKAITFHRIMTGKVLPYNINLIGKFKIIYYNEKGKYLASVYVPAKNNYCKIIKGTRFTLKSEENSSD
jgi:hypothetical protein